MNHTAEVTTPSDHEIRVTRRFNAPAARLFDAYSQPALLKRWLLGPPGWSMPDCAVDLRQGGAYRYVWRKNDGTAEFGAEGIFLEVSPPHRIVQTQRMFGALAGPMAEEIRCTVEFTDDAAFSVMTTTILYASKQNRDSSLATGMASGMEHSYARLAAEILQDQRNPH